LDNSEFENFTFTEARHMPIVKQYAKRLNLVETVNQMVDSHMKLSPGLAVMGMVIDTLSGRTPLYRLSAFFRDVDVPLLLGTNTEASLFEDHNLGRALDKIYETGTQKIFSQIALNAVNVFDVDVKRCHFDTTSVSVYGDYGFEDPPFQITYGHSKDHRPDLKQFLVTMLCVDRNIPILGATKNGNASDKALNNELLTDISKYMAKYKLQPGAYVYVADSAFVTEKNLKEAGSDIKFLSRLPATYNACHQAIQQAVGADEWQDIGTLAQNKGTQKRPPAQYRSFETTIDLYGNPYRAIVVHSSAHDKRRHKRIDRLIKQKRKPLEESCKKIASTPFFSREDAEKKFLTSYLENGVLDDNPFEVIDVKGVGRLMETAIFWARRIKRDIEIGVCGEQAGEPRSIQFFNNINIDYVSCSPYRVPVAKLVAAQASLRQNENAITSFQV